MATIRLQGLGEFPAIHARELRIGDVLSWNQSYRISRVTKIAEVSKYYLEIEETYIKTGETYLRRVRKDRLVGCDKRG